MGEFVFNVYTTNDLDVVYESGGAVFDFEC